MKVNNVLNANRVAGHLAGYDANVLTDYAYGSHDLCGSTANHR